MNTLTPLNYALLGLLNRKPATGYELMQIFETTPLGGYSSSPGAIYPALKKLRAADLVRVTGEGDGGRGQALEVTRQGRAVLKRWVASAPERGPGGIIDISSQMLKFTFIGDVLTLNAQLAFLDDFQSALAAASEALAGVRDQLTDRLNLHDLLAVEAGVMNYDAAIAWCANARTALSDSHSQKTGSTTS